MLVLYCIGFLCTLVVVRAYEQYMYDPIALKRDACKLLSRNMSACSFCRGTFYTDGETVKHTGDYHYTCIGHGKELDDLSTIDGGPTLFTRDSIMGAMVWPVALPLTMCSFVGKYIGSIARQKTIMKRFQIIHETKEMEKYLSLANEEISKYLENGA